MVTAVPQDQWRLLDVQGHDTKLSQIAHRRRTMPENAEVERLEAARRDCENLLVAARTRAGDIARELAKAEADVEQVRSRAARNQARMDAGTGTAKDLQALQHELEALAQRQAVLEDVELEVMERLETAEARVAEVVAEGERMNGALADAVARRARVVSELTDQEVAERRAREAAVQGLPADLLALYERVRANAGGVGAARIHQRRCEGCRLELNTTDLGRLRTAPDDAVVRCEECGSILVRTPDSGL
jgi:predicted  nucleic acid-binding Zn-ribbon protein